MQEVDNKTATNYLVQKIESAKKELLEEHYNSYQISQQENEEEEKIKQENELHNRNTKKV